MLPFHINVISAAADNFDMLHNDRDIPPLLLSQTVNEYVVDLLIPSCISPYSVDIYVEITDVGLICHHCHSCFNGSFPG